VALPDGEYSEIPRYLFHKDAGSVLKSEDFTDFTKAFASKSYAKSKCEIPKLSELTANESLFVTIETGGAGPKTVTIEFKYGCMHQNTFSILVFISLGVAKIGLFLDERLEFPKNDKFWLNIENRMNKVRKIIYRVSHKMDKIHHMVNCIFSLVNCVHFLGYVLFLKFH